MYEKLGKTESVEVIDDMIQEIDKLDYLLIKCEQIIQGEL